jgi:hypothetical protein
LLILLMKKMLKLTLCLCLASVASAQIKTGDVVGKLVVGYQGWFSAKGDGNPMGRWFHWTGQPQPIAGHETVELYPNVDEFNHTYATGYQPLGNGKPARLFSSFDQQTVDTQFKWMQEHNIDTAALQRFGNDIKNDPAYG